ncbi:L-threonylcarbamoyladenylate synthase [Trichothermofontia sp.]
MPIVSLDTLINGAIAGQLVSFPTDTVPALATRPDQADRIFAAKQRRQDKPLILMAATAADLWPFTVGAAPEQTLWQTIADRYWPGALTLVLPASPQVPRAMNPLDPTTIGLRVPDAAIARTILAQTGPLATTSANRSGAPPLVDMGAIAAQFPDALVLDPTVVSNQSTAIAGIPSTVAKWVAGEWQILRQGAITLGE